MGEVWREGLLGALDERYFRLVDRSTDMTEEVDWRLLDKKPVFEAFRAIFNNQENVQKEAYFDKMTHFDFKCLLPALLQVEDRMSMAHGLESRVPLLDHPLIEFLATVPADVKFAGGRMKHLLKLAYDHELPAAIAERRDKMGFPVPLKQWFSGELRDLVHDTFHRRNARPCPALVIALGLLLLPTLPRTADNPQMLEAFVDDEVWQVLALDGTLRWPYGNPANFLDPASSAYREIPAYWGEVRYPGLFYYGGGVCTPACPVLSPIPLLPPPPRPPPRPP